MRGAGLVPFDDITEDTPHPGADADGWRKRVHGSTDPKEIAHVHVRETDSPAWRFTLLFSDWLVHEASEREGYAAEKRRLVGLHDTTSAYAEAKEPGSPRPSRAPTPGPRRRTGPRAEPAFERSGSQRHTQLLRES